MKLSRRKTWIFLLLFCGLIWALILFSVAYAANTSDEKGTRPAEMSPEEIAEKIKVLDLTPQQRAFLEAMTRTEKDDDSGQ